MFFSISCLIFLTFSLAHLITERFKSGYGVCSTLLLIGAFINVFVGSFVARYCPIEYERVNVNVPIHSLAIDKDLTGRFYLGSGTVETAPCYYFYTSKDGFYSLQHEPASATRLKESDNAPIMHYQIIKYRLPEWFMPKYITCFNTLQYTKTDLYIPRNSIIKSFTPNP